MKTINTKASQTVIIRTENIERYLREIKEETKFSAETEKELIRRAQSGSISDRNTLIEAHLKFVISCAKEFQCKGVKMNDLIGAGNEGLILAVKKYDLSKDVRFITCAVWWIKYKLYEFVTQINPLIKIPLNQQKELRKIALKKEKIFQQIKAQLTDSDIIMLSEEIKNPNRYYDYIRPSIICSSEFESLDRPVNNEKEECTLHQLLPSESVTDIFIEREDRAKIIKRCMEKLPPIQNKIITLYYGLEDKVEKTDLDVFCLLNNKNLSPEKIRKIRLKTIKKLKNMEVLKKIF